MMILVRTRKEQILKNKAVLKNIILYLGLAVIVSGYVFNEYLNNLDEVWLYNFGRNLANRAFTL